MYEVVFKTTYDNFYSNLSRKYPSFKKYFWCNYTNDIIEIIVENLDEYRLVIEELNEHKSSGIIEESSDQQKIHMIVKNCSCEDENTVERYISSVNMLHIFPSILEKGWEYNRILFFRHEDFEALMQRLKENGFTVEILRKVPFDGYLSGSLTFTADALLSDLTEKQVDALLTAHRYGYYNLPRRADVQTIATKIQVPRTTFQEHLKKAENKLIAALAPYVQLFKYSSSDQKRRLKIKTRSPLLYMQSHSKRA
jgi:predicted DNA binding protein